MPAGKRISQAGENGFISLTPSRAGDRASISVIYPKGVRLEVSSADLGLLSRLIALV